MISVTPEAAKQIKESARQSQAEGMALRIAASRLEDGSIQYGMGFADDETENDLSYTSEGIKLVIAPISQDLLNNTVIDYVKLDTGEMNFIFKNPNDPAYQPTN
ncbi:MAG: iron-sulfur cluster assembly accessory protein [Gammaproteobacteria bacterium]|nr:iron-sulfur cluster assembly accessory protein [Gammaproteobacteria bacterium]MDH5777258.1 iron-sulfur cluster assembly accessory protein [Gammaproteobacteria bacterium]